MEVRPIESLATFENSARIRSICSRNWGELSEPKCIGTEDEQGWESGKSEDDSSES